MELRSTKNQKLLNIHKWGETLQTLIKQPNTYKWGYTLQTPIKLPSTYKWGETLRTPIREPNIHKWGRHFKPQYTDPNDPTKIAYITRGETLQTPPFGDRQPGRSLE